jgi:tRNA dimethylallyltransferase
LTEPSLFGRRLGRTGQGGNRRLHGEGRLPILVGGTGSILRTLLDGIAPIPPIDPKSAPSVARRRRRESAALAPLDPVRRPRSIPATRPASPGRWKW